MSVKRCLSAKAAQGMSGSASSKAGQSVSVFGSASARPEPLARASESASAGEWL